MKVKLRATITVEYEADSKYYDTDVIEEMIKIDLKHATVEDILNWGEPVIEIEEVK
jgi:hypothetical protein